MKKKPRKVARKKVTKALAVLNRPGRFPAAVAQAAPAPLLPETILGTDAGLGALGLVEIKLTSKEEAILSRPVNTADIRIKPSGQPYLSHPSYTRWFNEAFGRLGWTIVPKARPVKDASGSRTQVLVPYVLYIHGQPAAFAYGEQEYFEGGKEQTHGDAVEATVASALRRCAKRLGVGLEMWDRVEIDTYIGTHCVKVCVEKDGKKSYQWRRKVDPPFWNEVGPARSGRDERSDTEPSQRRGGWDGAPTEAAAPAEGTKRERLAGSNPAGGSVITEPQVKRLWAILRNSGRDEGTVKAWLSDRYGIDSTKAILRKHYDAICQAVESSSPLPPVVQR